MIEYFRSQILPLRPIQLLVKTGLKWQEDKCARIAAALSFYALFSLFPILLVILSVLGSLLGPDTNTVQHIRDIVQQNFPPETFALIESTVKGLNQASAGAGLIGTGLLIYAASTVFSVLNNAVSQIWQTNNSVDEPSSLRKSVFSYLLNRLTAFILVLGTALLLLVLMVSELAIQALLKFVDSVDSTLLNLQFVEEWQLATGMQTGSSFLILALAISILLKILPSAHVHWKDVLPGALLTTMLYLGLQRLVTSSVVSFGSQYLTYGAVGIVMILMMWIYLTCQIFLLGCEFSYSFAHLYGSRRYRVLGAGK